MEVRQLPKEFEKGFKFDYSKMKKVINACEYKGKESEDCKKLSKELNIDWID